MRIAWLSNAPWSTTGYGNQTRVFAPRLKQAGHEIAIVAFYGLEGGTLSWDGIPVYPRGFHIYGQDISPLHAMDFRADIMISLMDAWVCEPGNWPQQTRWVAWYPVDMEPLPNAIRDKVGVAYDRIVYSKFGQKMTEDAGLDCHYVPHGVDTETFRPATAVERSDTRRQLGIPEDAFVVGMIAANKGFPCRKSFFEQIEAFAELKRRHTDAFLYLHTLTGPIPDVAVNLPEACEIHGLRPNVDVRFAPQYQLMSNNFNDDAMAAIVGSLDVLTSVSMGEGFGLPILEAQACGVPVVVGDWTAMPELCFGGWKIDKRDAIRTYTPLASYQWAPRPQAIAKAYEAAYNANREMIGKRARKGALSYDADLVTREYWLPVLSQIAARIEAEPRPEPTPMLMPSAEMAVAGDR